MFYRTLTSQKFCLDALPYKQASENATRLRRELKAVEDEAAKVSDTVVQRRSTMEKTLRASGEVTTALTRARDQVKNLNGTSEDLLKELRTLVEALDTESKKLQASKVP